MEDLTYLMALYFLIGQYKLFLALSPEGLSSIKECLLNLERGGFNDEINFIVRFEPELSLLFVVDSELCHGDIDSSSRKPRLPLSYELSRSENSTIFSIYLFKSN